MEYITTTRGYEIRVNLWNDVDDFFSPYQSSLPQLSSQFGRPVPEVECEVDHLEDFK